MMPNKANAAIRFPKLSLSLVFVSLLFLCVACNDEPPAIYRYHEPVEGMPGDIDEGAVLVDGDASGEMPESDGSEEGTEYDKDAQEQDEEKEPEIKCLTLMNEPGFGDSMNKAVYAMAVFGDKLYAGTYNANGGTPLNDRPLTSDGAQLWAFDGEDWERVTDEGFGNPDNIAITTLTATDEYLFAGTYNPETGAEIWRSDDGESWRLIADEGLGDDANTRIQSAIYYNGDYYIGTKNEGAGGQVYRYQNGRFVQKGENGLGLPNNRAISAMTMYKGFIFLGTENPTGGELFRFSGEQFAKIVGLEAIQLLPPGEMKISAIAKFGRDMIFATESRLGGFGLHTTDNGVNVDAVFDGGYGDSRLTKGSFLIEFQDRLVIGVKNEGGFLSPYQEGGVIFQTPEGRNLFELAGEEGALAPAGIGNDDNYDFPAAVIFQEKLFIATAQCHFCRGIKGAEVWALEDVRCK